MAEEIRIASKVLKEHPELIEKIQQGVLGRNEAMTIDVSSGLPLAADLLIGGVTDENGEIIKISPDTLGLTVDDLKTIIDEEQGLTLAHVAALNYEETGWVPPKEVANIGAKDKPEYTPMYIVETIKKLIKAEKEE